MTPAFAATAPAPLRMAFLYVPNGIVMDEWTPKGQAAGVAPLPEELPRITRALAPYRKDVTMLSGLTSNGGRALGDGPGDHGRAGAAYLTGVHPRKTYGKDIQTGVLVDQVAAWKLEGATRFASIELGCEEGVQGGNRDNGYSCAYSNSISWRTPSSPMPPEIRPRAVFGRLFGSVETERDPKRRARQELYQKSVLDVVLEDARRLQSSLGGADRRKLDEYLYGIREIETRIQRTERSRVGVTAPAEAPSPSIPTDFAEHARIMMDLLTLAFQTDSTRVATVLLGIEQSPRSYGAEIGISEAHHGLTHHSGDREKIEKVTKINCYHIQQFTYLLDKLKAVKEGDGTLLDHSMIAYGSGLSDGNRHDHANLPLMLAGRLRYDALDEIFRPDRSNIIRNLSPSGSNLGRDRHQRTAHPGGGKQGCDRADRYWGRLDRGLPSFRRRFESTAMAGTWRRECRVPTDGPFSVPGSLGSSIGSRATQRNALSRRGGAGRMEGARWWRWQ